MGGACRSIGGHGAALAALLLALSPTRAALGEEMIEEDFSRKNERGYVTGLPLAAYSTDLGFGAGARGYYYWNGEREDPRFTTTPYLYRFFLQAFATTRGIQFHWFDIDAVDVGGSPYRIRSQWIFYRNIYTNYFGLGEDALEPLTLPGAATIYDRYGAFMDAQRRVDADGQTFSRYDHYIQMRPLVIASVERSFLDEKVRLLAGFGVSWTFIEDYSGEPVRAEGADGRPTTATMRTTRLRADCEAGRIVGCEGGRDNILRLGLAYDTRDFEPDPNRGVFLDLAIDLGTVALGSEYDYLRVLFAARGYWRPLEAHDLVFCGRLVVDGQTRGTPFFSMNTLSFTEDPRTGLGGHRTLRGYRQDRFVGSIMAVLNGEVRWTFARAELFEQKFAFMIVPFVDLGRPFDALDELTYRRWRVGAGGALRVTWNLATVFTLDYGYSPEDAGLYVSFNHIF